MYVKVLCDDRFDDGLTYQIDGEKMRDTHNDPCENCGKYAKCEGWAREFGKCEKEGTK